MYFCHNRMFDHMPIRLGLDQYADPYDYVGAFFHGYDLHTARRFLMKWLHAVTKEKPGKLDSERLHIFYTRIEKMMEAAFLINQLDNSDRAAILREPKGGHINPMETRLFFAIARKDKENTRPERLAWEYFPRFLNYKEFLDPYQAISKCFRHFNLGEWRELLSELYFLGIRHESYTYEDFDHDIPLLQKLLGKFLEACHLIELREEMVKIEEVMAAAIIEETDENNA